MFKPMYVHHGSCTLRSCDLLFYFSPCLVTSHVGDYRLCGRTVACYVSPSLLYEIMWVSSEIQ